MSTLETDEETLGAKQSQKDKEDLYGVENKMVETLIATSVLEQSINGTFGVSKPKPPRLDININRTLVEEGIDTPMTSSLAPHYHYNMNDLTRDSNSH